MQLFAESVLLAGGWARNVVIDVVEDGLITHISRDVKRQPRSAQAITGPVIPGVPNLHSHAFQRALVGHCERRGPGDDDFWTWRQSMYDFVSRVTPEQVQSITEQLYVEMLKAGYTAVAEFHYLHHDRNGQPYGNLTEMSDRIIAAAQSTGIAVTHLLVLYAHDGFGGKPPASGQRRFVNDIERYAQLLQALFRHYGNHGNIRIGAAAHSLRAVNPELLQQMVEALDGLDAAAPIHIHIAEQQKEVSECEAWCGQRPLAWLFDNIGVDRRWCLVHATHVVDGEMQRLAASGAVAGLCPTTEANLGDGLFPAVAYLHGGGTFGVGSDSHVSVSPAEELRWLEYGQRLLHQRRALLTRGGSPSVGAGLYKHAVEGGAQACGLAGGGLAVGKRADLVVLDPHAPVLIDKHEDLLLDAFVFAGNRNVIKDVMVGGRWRVVDARHVREDEILGRFREALNQLATP